MNSTPKPRAPRESHAVAVTAESAQSWLWKCGNFSFPLLVFQVGRYLPKVNWMNCKKKWPGGPRNRNFERNGRRNQRPLKGLTLILAALWTWMNCRIRVIVVGDEWLSVMGTVKEGRKKIHQAHKFLVFTLAKLYCILIQ